MQEFLMAKTITLRLDEKTYDLIRRAAAGERRSISNFIEYATVTYLSGEAFVSDAEMDEILNDNELTANLRRGKADIGEERFTVVE
jgi:uncharacterized protein (DUF1778 family)